MCLSPPIPHLQTIRDSLTAVDWDIFQPVSSEEELEEKASDYQWQVDSGITVLAGLVFSGLPEGEEGCGGMAQPKLYIRMNSTLVHDTTVLKER